MACFLILLTAFVICCADQNATSTVKEGVQKEALAIEQPIAETIVTVASSQCSNLKKLLGISYEELKGKKEPQVDQLTLEYRVPGIVTIYNITTAAELIPKSPEFNPAKKLLIFMHGFTDNPSKENFKIINDAFMSRGQSNVLAVDASSLIGWLYLRSSTYVRFIGEKLGEVLAAMFNKGLKSSDIHIIGHSLGAHISAFAGKKFTNLTGYNVSRITGLDPAGPCFTDIDLELRLKATDADFVDVIHTDAGVYGLKFPVGQVDYFPNSGSLQPNCSSQSCSHSRAVAYFAESVLTPDAFLALKCEDYEQFKKGQCESDISPMGFASEPGTTGRYYLQTGGNSPYGLGVQGLTWKNNEGILRTIGSKFSQIV